MFKTSLKNNLLLFLALALFMSANAAFAQSAGTTQTSYQCFNNRMIDTNGTQGGYCAPTSCPNGAATCSGTILCKNSQIDCNGNASCNFNGEQCSAPPATSGALQRDGVFGCSASKYQNIGSLTAVGGVYVPVNDAAVTLNTGYLVYKECVLDGVVSAIKNDAVASLTAQAAKAVQTSREGKPQYLQNFDDLNPAFDAIEVNLATAAKESPMCAAFKDRVITADVRNWYRGTRNDYAALTCPFTSEAERATVTSSQPIDWSNWNKLIDPRGYELGQYYVQVGQRNAIMSRYDFNIRAQLAAGNNFFPVFDQTSNPLTQKVLTPGIVIAQSLQQILGAGTEILVNANEINQVNGALQAGFTTSLLTGATNLLAATQSQNGQRSYLDRMTTEASSQVRQAAVNTALGILGTWYQTESLYKKAKEAVATALSNAIATIKGYEAQCWEAIIPKVEQYASTQNATLRIATSTEFSQKIINDQIAPLATTTINDLRASETALALIQELITNVTNSSSVANQQAALSRLDRLVAENRIHSPQDAQKANTDRDTILGAITVLLDDTKKAWTESPDTNIGWCNINNPDVVTMWFNKWKQ